MWNALKRRDFSVSDYPDRAAAPPCGGEDGSRREKCNSQDQGMAVWFILNGAWKSKTEIPAKTLPCDSNMF